MNSNPYRKKRATTHEIRNAIELIEIRKNFLFLLPVMTIYDDFFWDTFFLRKYKRILDFLTIFILKPCK